MIEDHDDDCAIWETELLPDQLFECSCGYDRKRKLAHAARELCKLLDDEFKRMLIEKLKSDKDDETAEEIEAWSKIHGHF
jgi:hypothetical protein